MQFRTTLEASGKTATGFRVPPEVVAALGKGKRPPVVVTLNGTYTYRNTVAVYGDEYLLGVSAEHRAASGVAAGDTITVDLELDTAPREIVGHRILRPPWTPMWGRAPVSTPCPRATAVRSSPW